MVAGTYDGAMGTYTTLCNADTACTVDVTVGEGRADRR